jgi:hypothetical protein
MSEKGRYYYQTGTLFADKNTIVAIKNAEKRLYIILDRLYNYRYSIVYDKTE